MEIEIKAFLNLYQNLEQINYLLISSIFYHIVGTQEKRPYRNVYFLFIFQDDLAVSDDSEEETDEKNTSQDDVMDFQKNTSQDDLMTFQKIQAKMTS